MFARVVSAKRSGTAAGGSGRRRWRRRQSPPTLQQTYPAATSNSHRVARTHIYILHSISHICILFVYLFFADQETLIFIVIITNYFLFPLKSPHSTRPESRPSAAFRTRAGTRRSRSLGSPCRDCITTNWEGEGMAERERESLHSNEWISDVNGPTAFEPRVTALVVTTSVPSRT